jgi:hypothetical protein
MPSLVDKPLSAQLDDYIVQHEDIKRSAQDLLEGLTPTQLGWKPTPERWSIGQCVQHLNLSDERALKAIDRMIDEARTRELYAHGPFKYRFLERLLIRFLEPPYRMRGKAVPALQPVDDLRKEEVLARFLTLQDDLIQRMRSANGLDLKAVRHMSPAKIAVSLGGWFEFLTAHDRRHLWQAQQVRQHPQFPR